MASMDPARAWLSGCALAGILAAGSLAAWGSLSAKEAASHIGEMASVCGIVASAKYAISSRGSPTFLNLDEPYPRHVFTAVIWGDDRTKFPVTPESLAGASVCVDGTISEYKGKPQIIVTNPKQLRTVR